MEKSIPFRNRTRARPIGELVRAGLAPALAKRGFGAAEIIARWDAIAGPRLAGSSEPLRLDWPRPRGEGPADGTVAPATLVVRATAGAAIEIQHAAPALIGRINALLGWRCVAAIALRQGPVGRAARVAPRPPPPTEDESARSAALAAGVKDGALRDSLARLGAAAAADRRAKPAR